MARAAASNGRGRGPFELLRGRGRRVVPTAYLDRHRRRRLHRRELRPHGARAGPRTRGGARPPALPLGAGEPGAACQRPRLRSHRGQHRRARHARIPVPGLRAGRGDPLRGRDPRGPLDRRAGGLRRHQRHGHPAPARSHARLSRPGAVRKAGRLPLPPRLHRRGVRRPRPRRSALHRSQPLRPQFPLRRLEGRRGPSRARRPRDLRPAGDRHPLHQQLRPPPASREADPHGHRECGEGRAHPGLWRWPAAPRLAACGRPLPRPAGRARAGRARGELYLRRRRGRGEQRPAGDAVRRARRGPARGPAPRPAAPPRGRPAGPRPALRRGLRPRARCSAGGPSAPSPRAWARRCAGTSTTPNGSRAPSSPSTIPGSSAAARRRGGSE